MKTLTLCLLTSLLTPQVLALPCDLSGIWQHTEKSAQLKVDVTQGEISVYSHLSNPAAEGQVVIKNLQISDEASVATAAMYHAEQDSFVKVDVFIANCNILTINHGNQTVLTLKRVR